MNLAPVSRLTLPGLDVPGSYGDPEAEYRTLADGVGIIDLSHEQFVLCEGPDAASFLQGMLTEDVLGTAVGDSRDAWMLNASGKILHLVRVNRLQPDQFLLQTRAGEAQAVHDQLNRYLIMEDARLEIAGDRRCLSLQGKAASSPGLDCFVTAHDRCGFGGYDLLVKSVDWSATIAALREEGAVPVGFAALNRARIQAFIPWFGPDMQTGNNPLIYGRNRVSHAKGCFIGQETVAKTRDRGRPPRLLVQLESRGDRAPEPGLELTHEDKPAGAVTSAASMGSDRLQALAVAKYGIVEAATELFDSEGRRWAIIDRVKYK
ncbi:MAG: hypothetical protein QNK37_00690 [Acidobacteriota bacterium]|nr:hypothetical protein [Acidobacteriota bacterium]